MVRYVDGGGLDAMPFPGEFSLEAASDVVVVVGGRVIVVVVVVVIAEPSISDA